MSMYNRLCGWVLGELWVFHRLPVLAKSFTRPFARLHRVLGLFLTRSLPMGKLYGVKFKFEFKIGNSSKDLLPM
jgi:hypothetical protein